MQCSDFIIPIPSKITITLQVREHSESKACVEDTSLCEKIDSDFNGHKGVDFVIDDEANSQTGTGQKDGLVDIYHSDSGSCTEDASLHGKFDPDAEDERVQRQYSPCQNVVFLNQPSEKNLMDTGAVSLHLEASY